jgi:hypothetical protein
MKKQIATLLAGTAATVAGGLRLIQELVRRDEVEPYANGSGPSPRPDVATDAGTSGGTGAPRGQKTATSPPAPSSTVPEPSSAAASATEPAPAGRDLSRSSKAELYAIATDMDVKGRSGMSKAELIKAIETASTT